MKNYKFILLFFFFIPIFFDATSQTRKVQNVPKNTKQTFKKLTGTEIYEKYSTAVFRIYTNFGQGSGFFITPTLAVTNCHVLEGASIYEIKVLLVDGTTLSIDEILEHSSSVENDYAVFRVKNYKCKTYIPIELNMNKIHVGQTCYAIGSPLGLENTFSQGLISQTKYLKTEHIIQTNAPFDHGSSGGVLLNEYGKVIGITCAGRDDSGANLNFARSIDVLSYGLRKKLYDWYQSKNKVKVKEIGKNQ